MKRRKRRSSIVVACNLNQWSRITQAYNNACIKCWATPKHLTKDHVIPQSKGGKGGLSNIQPMCGPCNNWKGSSHVDFRVILHERNPSRFPHPHDNTGYRAWLSDLVHYYRGGGWTIEIVYKQSVVWQLWAKKHDPTLVMKLIWECNKRSSK